MAAELLYELVTKLTVADNHETESGIPVEQRCDPQEVVYALDRDEPCDQRDQGRLLVNAERGTSGAVAL